MQVPQGRNLTAMLRVSQVMPYQRRTSDVLMGGVLQCHIMTKVLIYCTSIYSMNHTGWPRKMAQFFVRLNFIKY